MKPYSAIVAAGLVVFLSLLFRCDDIYSPIEERTVKPAPRKPAPEEGAKKLTKQDFEKIYRFVLNIRNQVRMNYEKLMELKEVDEGKFIEKKSKYQSKARTWNTMLKVRKEWLKDASKDISPGSPLPALSGSINYLVMEMKRRDRALTGLEEYDPKLSEQVDQQLKRARELLNLYGADRPMPVK